MKSLAAGFCLAIAPLTALAQPNPARNGEEIGSWIVNCSDGGKAEPLECQLRHRVWIIPPGGTRPSVDLEVAARHGSLAPILAVHGLTVPEPAGAMLALSTDATVQFDADLPIQLPCGFARGTIACAPSRADAAQATQRLRLAKTVTVRLHLVAPASPGLAVPVPDQTRSLELHRTADAMNRIQPAGATADQGEDLADILDWLAQKFGFPGGSQEFLRWLLGQAAALGKA